MVSSDGNSSKISIIIPTYNRAYGLKETINSALNQTYPNTEVIVVDDGSTDNTREVCAGYGGRIRYVYQENHGRPAAARNTGIRVMKGNYAAFLDDDDVWMPNKLECQIRFFVANADIHFIFTKAEEIAHDGTPLGKFRPAKDISSNFEGLIQSNFIMISSVIIKKHALKDVGNFDENVLNCSDYDFNVRAADRFKIHFLDTPLIKYRISNNAMSKDRLKIHQGEIYFLNKFLKKCFYSEREKLVKIRIKKSHYQLAKEYLERKDILRFMKHYLKSKLG